MPKIRREHTAIVTVQLQREALSKLDAMATRLNRSRADMVRQMIACAEITGQPDLRVAGVAHGPAHRGHDAA
jgi:predicted transcriptional regulator